MTLTANGIASPRAGPPEVSILILCGGDGETAERCLTILARQAALLPEGEVEIVVCAPAAMGSVAPRLGRDLRLADRIRTCPIDDAAAPLGAVFAAGVRSATGRFVWPCRARDIPSVDALSVILDTVREGRHAFLLHNALHTVADEFGTARLMPERPDGAITMAEAFESIGLTTGLAALTPIVLRRNDDLAANLERFLADAPSFGHVGAIVATFLGEIGVAIARPLALLSGPLRPDEPPPGIGVPSVAQLAATVERLAHDPRLPAGLLARARESGEGGLALWATLLIGYLDQLGRSYDGSGPEPPPSQAELHVFRSALAGLAPGAVRLFERTAAVAGRAAMLGIASQAVIGPRDRVSLAHIVAGLPSARRERVSALLRRNIAEDVLSLKGAIRAVSHHEAAQGNNSQALGTAR